MLHSKSCLEIDHPSIFMRLVECSMRNTQMITLLVASDEIYHVYGQLKAGVESIDMSLKKGVKELSLEGY